MVRHGTGLYLYCQGTDRFADVVEPLKYQYSYPINHRGVVVARPGIKSVSVYMTAEQVELLKEAAELENRPLSNFLLTTGLREAERIMAEKKNPRKR